MKIIVLIQVVGQACQVASVTSAVSRTMKSTGTGGLLQSPAPTRGYANCNPTKTMSSDFPTNDSAATLLVASGIKNFN